MKVAGIIAEYNPFHNGHLHQIEEVRRITGVDYIIIVMSGDFVQRGSAACIDKYTRCQMALSEGADLVLELPSLYACSSAEFFSKGAVSLLNATNVVDFLCFGAECKDLASLQEITKLLVTEDQAMSNSFRELLQRNMKEGDSFPVARKKALAEILSDSQAITKESLDAHAKDSPHLLRLLDSPNNILAIEYLKALEELSSTMTPVLIPREGDGYHDTTTNSTLASATAIRKKMQSGNLFELENYMPAKSHMLLMDYANEAPFLNEDALSQVLGYKLLIENDFTKYVDCSDDLSDKIVKNRRFYSNYTQFCHLLHSKELTYARISRVLLHIVLGHTKKDFQYYLHNMPIPYMRVLGFRSASSELLSEIKKASQVPLITKVADSGKVLADEAYHMLKQDFFAADLYEQLKAYQTGSQTKNEFNRGLILY